MIQVIANDPYGLFFVVKRGIEYGIACLRIIIGLFN